MNIRELREKSGLTQTEFGKRIGVQYQTVLLYEKGGKVPETVKKLIQYEFGKFLPEEEQLSSDLETEYSRESSLEIKRFQERIAELEKFNEELKAKVENLQKYNNLQDKTIKSLDDQVKMYKDQLKTKEKSKTV